MKYYRVWSLAGLNFKLLSGVLIRRPGCGVRSLVSIPNIPELNPKYLYSAYDLKAYEYILLIAIRLSDGDVKSSAPLGALR
jgi:hypothetical protein